MYRIGCGSIAPEALQFLALLEKRFPSGPIRLGDVVTISSSHLLYNFQITKWTVGDLVTPEPVKKRSSRLTRSSESTGEPDPLVAELTGLLDEGSGLLPNYRFSSPASSPIFYPPFDGLTKTAPRLQPISPIKITVHQITNVQFPPKTFEKFDDVINNNLVVTLYRPDRGNVSELEIRSPNTPVERFGAVIPRDTREWISFDPKSKIVRLRPLPQHVGNHQMILCALAPNRPRACGMYWCYRIPIYWFEELKATSFENLELSVNGDSPFSWDVQSAEICVVTVLRVEQIITLFFHASNSHIAQSVEIEFRLSAKVPTVQRLVSSSRLRLSLQWPKGVKSYQLRELNRLNATLAQALRVRVNPEVTAPNLFIYDIIHFFNSANNSLPARLELEWVFLPKGLPIDVDRDPLGDLEQLRKIPRVGTLTGHQTSYLDRPAGLITLPDLLKLCKTASLDGAEAALRATAESFRPFKLDEVTQHELENSACHKARQLTGRTSAGGSSLTSWGSGETSVAFKKIINPEKATLLKRIQFMELVDSRNAYGEMDGIAMSSLLRPVLADLFMTHLEQKGTNMMGRAILYKRYVDDTLVITES
ncbi:unnamed protein product [Echinostoma caproni]|uniref:Reverse transcriptase domain-containing protein n=1 Tax=Echinostoma caproni TaxID=27848 RepID=A0A183A7P9_9TREM|nr:unnamed protein product [Echinostoma caproni]